MATKKVIELEAKADKAIGEIEELRKEIEKLNKEVVSSNKKTEDSLKGVEDASNATAKGLRGIGTAIKAIGIGLLLEAFNFFKETIGENQKAVDFFATTFETLSLAFNDFINFVSDNFGTVTGFFKGIFQDPIGSIKDFGAAIIDGVVNRVKQAIEVLGNEYLRNSLNAMFGFKSCYFFWACQMIICDVVPFSSKQIFRLQAMHTHFLCSNHSEYDRFLFNCVYRRHLTFSDTD